MRKVLLNVAVSLDGFIEGPNGEFDWCFTDQDYGMKAFFGRINAMFIGRKSYEVALGMEEVNAGFFPKMQEYVFSNSLEQVKGDRILVRGDIEQQVRAIKQTEGKDIWLFGGADLTASLLDLGLVDEIGMAVHPLLLGAGKPLFSNIQGRLPLVLADAKTYSSGLVFLRYTF